MEWRRSVTAAIRQSSRLHGIVMFRLLQWRDEYNPDLCGRVVRAILPRFIFGLFLVRNVQSRDGLRLGERSCKTYF